MDSILRQRFPHCLQLYTDVSSRPRIAHWRDTARPPSSTTSSPTAGVDVTTVRPRDWIAVSPHGSYERVREIAARDQSGELQLEIDFATKSTLVETQ